MPTRAGAYRLRALLGSDHVSGSPSVVTVRAGQACALRLRAPPHALQCGEPYGPIAVWAVDAYGNPVAGASFDPVGIEPSTGISVEILDKAWRGVKGRGKDKDKWKWGPKYQRKEAERKGARILPPDVHSAIMDEIDQRAA